jgi:hypothetical protein
VRPTPKPVLQVRTLCNQNRSLILHFSRKTVFERKKSATDFRFKQTSCSIISEPSSNNLMVKKISVLVDSCGKYHQFSVSTQNESPNFSSNGTQRRRFCSTCEFTIGDVVEMSLRLLLSFRLIIMG